MTHFQQWGETLRKGWSDLALRADLKLCASRKLGLAAELSITYASKAQATLLQDKSKTDLLLCSWLSHRLFFT